MRPSGAMYGPILLQSVIPTVAASQSKTIQDESQLRNRLNTPMLLDEIRIMSDYTSITPDPYELFLKLELGDVPLTNGHIPLGLLGTEMDPIYSSGRTFVNPINAPLTWRLPKPLFLRAGQYLRPYLLYVPLLPSGGSETRNYYITYVGRSLPKDTKPPRTIPIPWACAFLGDHRTSNGTYLSESTEADLNNPFNEPLHVQRFMGIVDMGEDAVSGAYTDFTRITATDSAGKILVRDPTDMDVLFIGDGHAWTVNSILPPKGFYKFSIEQEYIAANITFNSGTLRPMISMIGYREVAQ